jgi:hypothetical protein
MGHPETSLETISTGCPFHVPSFTDPCNVCEPQKQRVATTLICKKVLGNFAKKKKSDL